MNQTIIVAVLLALLGGASVSLQGPSISMIQRRVSWLNAALIVHLGGLAFIGLLMLLQADKNASWARLGDVPWWLLPAGGLGLVMVICVGRSIPHIGAAAFTAFVMVGQFTVSMVIDQFGLFEVSQRVISPGRALGLAVMAAGAWLLLRF